MNAIATQKATSFAALTKRDHPVGEAALLDVLVEFGGEVDCGTACVIACESEVDEPEVNEPEVDEGDVVEGEVAEGEVDCCTTCVIACEPEVVEGEQGEVVEKGVLEGGEAVKEESRLEPDGAVDVAAAVVGTGVFVC